MIKSPLVISVVVHYNSPGDCLNLIRSLLHVKYVNHKIVIVDNCSDYHSYELLIDSLVEILDSDKCEVIKNIVNVGFGGGVNFGFDYAISKYKPDYLHVINTDAEVINKGYLSSLIEILERDKKIGIIGPAVLKENRIEVQNTILPFVTLHTALNFKKKYTDLSYIEVNPTVKDIDCVNGVCFLMPADVFSSVGGFDVSYFMYGEEQDLCYKIYQKGFKRVFWSGLSIIHYGAEKDNNLIDWRYVHVRKNQVSFLSKHDNLAKAVLLATLFSISLLIKLLTGSKLQGETLGSIINQYYSRAFRR